MAEKGICTLTVLIPHGNILAQLNEEAEKGNELFKGLPQCIPLRIETDELFRTRWQSRTEKYGNPCGFRVVVDFRSILEKALEHSPFPTESRLTSLRAAVPSNRAITFTGPLCQESSSSDEFFCFMVMGIKKVPDLQFSEADRDSFQISCSTFRFAELQLEISETGLLVWRELDSVWAARKQQKN